MSFTFFFVLIAANYHLNISLEHKVGIQDAKTLYIKP